MSQRWISYTHYYKYLSILNIDIRKKLQRKTHVLKEAIFKIIFTTLFNFIFEIIDIATYHGCIGVFHMRCPKMKNKNSDDKMKISGVS